MAPDEALHVLGGVADRARLFPLCGRRQVAAAIDRGAIVRLARDRYALPSVAGDVARAHAVRGTLCLTSAALQHGWGILRQPERTHVALARGRRPDPSRLVGVEVHRLDPGQREATGIATSREVTLGQCLRRLPFEEALAVADSALRTGEQSLLRRLAVTASGPGSAQLRRVAATASAEAANPFESALRAIALDVPGLRVEPQVLITSVDPWARVDLADRDLRIVLEADSFEWHGGRSALDADAARYNRLIVDGWLVLRFSWEAVMFRPQEVRATLAAIVARATGYTDPTVRRLAGVEARRRPA